MNREQKIGVGVVGGIIGGGLLYEYGLKPLLSKTPTQSITAQVPAVTGLTATVQGSSVVLAWQPVQVQGASVSYILSAPAISLSQQTAQTTYTVASFGSAQAGATVQAQVAASVGGQTGQAATVTFSVPAQTLPVVAGITAKATSATTATISWQPAQGLTGAQYAIRHVDAAGAVIGTNMGNVAPQVTVSQTSIAISSLTAGDTLHFEVAVVLGKQIGPWSAVQTLTMPAATSTGGGGSYTGGNVAQCQTLASEQAAITQQVASLSATYTNQINSLTTQRNNLIAQNTQLCNSLTAQGQNCDTNPTFIATGNRIASLYSEITSLQSQLANNTQINSLKRQAVQIGQQMSSLGCF